MTDKKKKKDKKKTVKKVTKKKVVKKKEEKQELEYINTKNYMELPGPRDPRDDARFVHLSTKQLLEIQVMSGLGLTVKEIADNLGIPPRTLTRRMADTEEVRYAYDLGRAKAKKYVTGKLWNMIEAGDKAAVFFFLKTQCGWRETNNTELKVTTGQDDENQTKYKDIDALMKERFKQLLNKDDKDDGEGKSR